MHILLLNDDALPTARGGAAVIVDHLRHGFAAKGHKVTLITTHQDSEEEKIWGDAAGAVISIPVKYDLKRRHEMCVHNLEVSRRLEKLFEELKPDVVHAHNLHTYLTYESLNIAKKYTDRLMLTAHDTFLVSFDRVRGSAYERAALSGKPYRMYWWKHVCDAGRKYRPLRNRAIRKILHETSANVIAISNATAVFLEANGISVHTVIPNGISPSVKPSDDEMHTFRGKFGLTGPTIFFAGRIREDKGIRAALNALEQVRKKIPDAQFLVAGEEERLKPFVDEHTRDAVISTGWISPEEMRSAYAASDVVITPSIYLDNFPTVNLEAMSAGKPVIGTCFGGTQEAVEDEVTGVIVNPRQTELFSDAIIEILNNPDRAQAMGLAGRKRLEEQFSLEKQIKQYLI